MKKIIFISVLTLLLMGCYKEPYPQDRDNEYLVYTSSDNDVLYTSYRTFNLADSLLIIGQTSKPIYSQSNNALELIRQVKVNMENLGYIYTTDNSQADLGIQMTYIIKTERYVQYYDDPYWWYDYPGYWPSEYWGNGIGFYYPYPVIYTYSTNALITDMVDLMTEHTPGAPLNVVWTSYIGGPAGSSLKGDVRKMKNSIDQSFIQSPYLKRDVLE